MLAEHLEQCTQKRSLNSKCILMIVSDNGSNMIKAVWLLSERQLHEEYECAAVGEEPIPDDDG